MLKEELQPGSVLLVGATSFGAAHPYTLKVKTVGDPGSPGPCDMIKVTGLRLGRDGALPPGEPQPVTADLELDRARLLAAPAGPLCHTDTCPEPARWASRAPAGEEMYQFRCDEHRACLPHPDGALPWAEVPHRAYLRHPGGGGRHVMLVCRCGWCVWLGTVDEAATHDHALPYMTHHDTCGWAPLPLQPA